MTDSKKPLILIADEDLACLDVLVKMLKILGYNVIAVRNRKEAIEAYASMKNKIDLVILDMKKPLNLFGLNSPLLAAIESIKAFKLIPHPLGQALFIGEKADTKLRKINKNARILLISGYTEDFQVRTILEHGYSGLVEKPFKLNSLKTNISIL